MIKKLYRKFNKLMHENKSIDLDLIDSPIEQHPLSTDIDENIKRFKDIFDSCSDVIFREFRIGSEDPIRAMIIYIDGLSKKDAINESLLKSLMVDINITRAECNITKNNIFGILKNQIIALSDITESEDVIELVNFLLSGEMALIIDNSPRALIMSSRGWEKRSIEEPVTETLVRGPRDGFTETLRTNTTLIRRRIKTSRLKMEIMKIGVLTKTDVVIAFIKGIANDKVVEEVRRRLKHIEVDSILDSGYIEEFIEDTPYTPFPLIANTERPDKVAACLLEGQVAIIVDTSPFVLLAPITFFHLMQASEDYYNRYPFATAIRLLRFFAVNVGLLLPSLYIAIVTFHQEMLPTPLLISIASAREGVPFPAFVEALLMELTFEILREAGIRLPRNVGQAVSIVGALVIGQAAVSAGLVSPAMVIVVALTAIASFTIPNTGASLAIRGLRFPMMILAAILGLFGIMIGLMAILIHLCTLRSFGTPYFAPFAPTIWGDLKDVLVRAPWWKMSKRPTLIGQKEPDRQDNNLKPEAPSARKSLDGSRRRS